MLPAMLTLLAASSPGGGLNSRATRDAHNQHDENVY